LQAHVPPLLSDWTVPPLALKVPPVMVREPSIDIVLLGAVNVPPVSEKVATDSVLYVPALKSPAAMSVLPLRPLKPVIVLPLLIVNVPAVYVNVPDPVSVPLRVTPRLSVGFAPSGKVQLLLTVLVDVPVIITLLNVILLQDNVPFVPPNSTVPPLALNVPPVTDNVVPITKLALAGAVIVPELKESDPANEASVYEPRSNVPPFTTTDPATDNPEKPLRLPPAPVVNADPSVNVPLPLSVPLLTIPRATLGLLPSGTVHPELIVLLFEVCVNITRLNGAPPQFIDPDVPSNSTVPPLALKVPPLKVRLDEMLIVPEGAVSVPELRVRLPFMSTVV
jgi:hypothetical protein